MTLRPEVSAYISTRNRAVVVHADTEPYTVQGNLEIVLHAEEFRNGIDELFAEDAVHVTNGLTELDAIYLIDLLPSAIPFELVSGDTPEERADSLGELLHAEVRSIFLAKDEDEDYLGD